MCCLVDLFLIHFLKTQLIGELAPACRLWVRFRLPFVCIPICPSFVRTRSLGSTHQLASLLLSPVFMYGILSANEAPRWNVESTVLLAGQGPHVCNTKCLHLHASSNYRGTYTRSRGGAELRLFVFSCRISYISQ